MLFFYIDKLAFADRTPKSILRRIIYELMGSLVKIVVVDEADLLLVCQKIFGMTVLVI